MLSSTPKPVRCSGSQRSLTSHLKPIGSAWLPNFTLFSRFARRGDLLLCAQIFALRRQTKRRDSVLGKRQSALQAADLKPGPRLLTEAPCVEDIACSRRPPAGSAAGGTIVLGSILSCD